ncbi:NAD(P)-binding protein [Dissoconium aciculare CBS 342.82]|uniref:NAD(P)-binding protein n=1 Tax=Dissoconium aciculare CBS 342.82 TaxID=1314786 RepID=A0A6J3LW55_9PEZI|nr:NAD(P)-binding protein [Dissoconium aciculare CBS 342.82]KAF1819494.1 NAD(P)-binding protein [Dissoconium aciculare CBS 342.82]
MAKDSAEKDLLLIVAASGKLGFATLNALLDRQLLPASQIVCTTSSEQGEKKLAAAVQQGVQVRRATFDDSIETWTSTLHHCTKLFLISSPRGEKDYGDAPDGEGRETDHFLVLEAAKRAGVQHVYYTSLAFANPSLSRVMKAHERTEVWLQRNSEHMDFTILREGLYSESWPLHLGYYDLKNDDRSELLVAGDGQISWTSIPDLGLANAVILTAPRNEWLGKTCYLTRSVTCSLSDVANMVSSAVGREIKLKVTSRDEYERYYEHERGIDHGMVTWWSKTYDALKLKECEVRDPTLERLLQSFDVKPEDIRETVRKMLTKK